MENKVTLPELGSDPLIIPELVMYSTGLHRFDELGIILLFRSGFCIIPT